jgi:hypothetical protein
MIFFLKFSIFSNIQADAILVRSAGVLQQLNQLGGTGAYSSLVNTTIPPLYGDFSLNAANALSVGILLQSGLERITPTHDCNADQIVAMQNILTTGSITPSKTGSDGTEIYKMKAILSDRSSDESSDVHVINSTSNMSTNIAPAHSKLEVILHQHLAIFHTEHCVFCRYLSDGNSYKDCGHPCESNHVSLRSMDGAVRVY